MAEELKEFPLSQKDVEMVFNSFRRVWPRTERYLELRNSFQLPDTGPGRGKYWYICQCCKARHRGSNIALDHIDPVVPLDKPRSEMTIIEYLERMFLCPDSNFQVLCKTCHRIKSNDERIIRMEHRKTREKTKSKQ